MRARGWLAAALCLPGLLGTSPAAASEINGVAAPEERPPVVTLIIDDLGYDPALARRTLALPRPFSIAILPESPLARAMQDAAGAHDIDVMLHLPMEAGDRSPGQTTLSDLMDEGDLRDAVREALGRVPAAIAVNNHEGSRLTADAAAMAVVMDELRLRGNLMFVDSRTTSTTVAGRSAVEAGLPSASRDVFLDHDPDPAAIDRAFDHWLALARRRGCALAIGHPRRSTLEVLERRLAALGDQVDRVDLTTYIDRCGHVP